MAVTERDRVKADGMGRTKRLCCGDRMVMVIGDAWCLITLSLPSSTAVIVGKDSAQLHTVCIQRT